MNLLEACKTIDHYKERFEPLVGAYPDDITVSEDGETILVRFTAYKRGAYTDTTWFPLALADVPLDEIRAWLQADALRIQKNAEQQRIEHERQQKEEERARLLTLRDDLNRLFGNGEL